jgi:hypothetical protein
MGDTFTAQEVRNAFRTLRDYLRDLDQPKFDLFATKLRLFVNYVEMDDLSRTLARSLHARGGDVKAWFAKAAAGETPALPRAGAALLGYWYATLGEMKKQGIEIRNYVSTVFTGYGGFLEAYAAFREAFIAPFQRAVEKLTAAIEADLPAEPGAKIDLGAVIESHLAGEAPAAASAPPLAEETKKGIEQLRKSLDASTKKVKEAKGKAAAAAQETLEQLWKTLDVAAKKAKDLVADAKKDLETDLKIVKLELAKHKPNADVLLAVVRPIERLGGALGDVGAAIRAKLEGAKK